MNNVMMAEAAITMHLRVWGSCGLSRVTIFIVTGVNKFNCYVYTTHMVSYGFQTDCSYVLMICSRRGIMYFHNSIHFLRGGLFTELKKSLLAVFSQFGKILEVLAFKTLKHKGQAWVVFEEVSSATNALKQMQGFPFYDKPMRIQYAKTKSDIIAKADGTFVPREKRKKHEEKADKKRKEQHHDANQAGQNPAYSSAYGLAPPLSQIPYPGAQKSVIPEAPAPPNNILFIQNLPHETTSMMLQMLFCQYPGFKEVRMIEAKPGIAFVEYADEMQATVAMQGLQGFKITPQNPMVVTYAKK